MKRCVILGLIFNLYFASLGVQGLKGQCEKAENCCKGRNSACVVNGLQSDGSMVDEPCYCDEGCLETGDCCHDYKRTCNAEGKSNFRKYFNNQQEILKQLSRARFFRLLKFPAHFTVLNRWGKRQEISKILKVILISFSL